MNFRFGKEATQNYCSLTTKPTREFIELYELGLPETQAEE